MTGVLVLIALLAYAGGIVAFGRGPLYLNSNILGTIVNFIATLVPAGLFLLVSSQRYVPSQPANKGYLWAIYGGLCIGVFTLAMTKLFSDGSNVSFVTPLVYGGAVFLSSMVGVLIYKEKVNAIHFGGLLLIVVGIALVSYATWKKVV